MGKNIEVGPSDALVLIDMQKDFFEGGFFPVQGAEKILEPLLSVMSLFSLVVATQDWHRMERFKGAGPVGKDGVYDTGVYEQGHCIERTPGADLHPILATRRPNLVIQRPPREEGEYFSIFENSELATWLTHRGSRKIFMMGFTTEYGVKETVLDGLNRGFEIYVLSEGIRARGDPADEKRALEEMKRAGAHFVSAGDLAPASRGGSKAAQG